jgi:peptidoglycan/LPS O-acetylase OafA/YrhL
LTSLRFFAAAMIVHHHWQEVMPQAIVDLPLSQGVSFFFVLSGFILSYAYPSLEEPGSAKKFFVARFARIWPAHAATFFLFVMIHYGQRVFLPGEVFPLKALANLFMLQSLIPLESYNFSYNAVSWSISTEFMFYLCFPLLIYRWDRTWLLKFLAVLLMTAGTIWFCGHMIIGGSPTAQAKEIAWSLIYINPLGRIFEFAFGMVMQRVWRRLSGIAIGPAAATALELIAIGLVVASFKYNRPGLYSLDVAGVADYAAVMWLGCAGTFPFFGILIVMMGLEKGVISRLLSHSVPVRLGEISYSLYLVHKMLIPPYVGFVAHFFGPPTWSAYVFFWIALLTISYFMWRFVETPSRRILRVWSPKVYAWRLCPVALALVTVAYVAAPPETTVPIVAAPVEKVISDKNMDALDVKFGNMFNLRAAKMFRREGELKIEVVWESLIDQRSRYNVAVHFVDATGRILWNDDYPQDRRYSPAVKGAVWLDTIRVPVQKLEGVQAIGLCLYNATEKLQADSGNCDWGGSRLILPINRPHSIGLVGLRSQFPASDVSAVPFNCENHRTLNLDEANKFFVEEGFGAKIRKISPTAYLLHASNPGKAADTYLEFPGLDIKENSIVATYCYVANEQSNPVDFTMMASLSNGQKLAESKVTVSPTDNDVLLTLRIPAHKGPLTLRITTSMHSDQHAYYAWAQIKNGFICAEK